MLCPWHITVKNNLFFFSSVCGIPSMILFNSLIPRQKRRGISDGFSMPCKMSSTPRQRWPTVFGFSVIHTDCKICGQRVSSFSALCYSLVCPTSRVCECLDSLLLLPSDRDDDITKHVYLAQILRLLFCQIMAITVLSV